MAYATAVFAGVVFAAAVVENGAANAFLIVSTVDPFMSVSSIGVAR